MGAATAAVHHALFNYLQENDLFGIVCFMHPGFHMVVFHALFVVAQTAVLMVMAVRMAQDARSASEVARLASVINREPGCLTLAVNDAARYSPFARTFSTTLDTMRDTLTRVSAGVNALLAASDTLLERNAGLSARTDEQAQALAVVTRAGEQGKRFAVVASEVRTLAQRCEFAAKDIRELIAVSVARADDGSARVEQAGATMREMIASIDSLRRFIEDLSQMSEQQRSSIGDMRNSITSIDESVQQNAHHVAQTLNVAQHQQQQTRALQQAITLFRFA
ncbi:methyl-accepting chemotaxis protein [Siccibacter colletis]|uniref:methyl-accepting chemotaxis protein n=1 Tax=Siccibacter colletis TaxID=1505757 RepID=UPI0028BDFCFE|nr:methyl-accepting chemotaxis protein [Siccibacter colletis]WNN49118.1 methyl-accepting chemotaxis protein [Siccibacter colletis]